MKRNYTIIWMILLILTLGVPNLPVGYSQPVTVYAATQPTLSHKKVYVFKGKKLKIQLKNVKSKVKWTCDNNSIASISSEGVITGKRVGTTKVVATYKGQKYYCSVIVESPQLNKTKLNLTVGKTYRLKVTGTKQAVKWSSSNKNIVTVQNGLVHAKRVGSANITSTVAGKYKIVCKIIVKKKETIATPTPTPIVEVESIELNKSECSIYRGLYDQLEVAYYPLDANIYRNTVWSSSDNSVVSVEDGRIYAENVGTATVYVQYGELSASCDVTVLKNKEMLKDEAYNNYVFKKDALYTDINSRYKDELYDKTNQINDSINALQQKIENLERQGYYYGSDSSYNSEHTQLYREITTLEAQIAALEGTTNQADKARLYRLKAERDKKKGELDKLETLYKNKRSIEMYESMLAEQEKQLARVPQTILAKYQEEYNTKVAELEKEYLEEISRIDNLY